MNAFSGGAVQLIVHISECKERRSAAAAAAASGSADQWQQVQQQLQRSSSSLYLGMLCNPFQSLMQPCSLQLQILHGFASLLCLLVHLKQATLPLSQLHVQLVQLEVVGGGVPGQHNMLQREQAHAAERTCCPVLCLALCPCQACPAGQTVLQQVALMAVL